MNKESNTDYVQTAKQMVINILRAGDTPYAVNDLLEIRHNNLNLLKDHIKAIHNIFTKALNELEEKPNTRINIANAKMIIIDVLKMEECEEHSKSASDILTKIKNGDKQTLNDCIFRIAKMFQKAAYDIIINNEQHRSIHNEQVIKFIYYYLRYDNDPEKINDLKAIKDGNTIILRNYIYSFKQIFQKAIDDIMYEIANN